MNIDTVITLIIPSIIIVVLNIRISITMYMTQKMNHSMFRMDRGGVTTIEQGVCLSSSDTTSSLTGERLPTDRARSHNTSTQTNITRMLLLVSTVFVILNLPSHLFRIYSFFMTLASSTFTISSTAQCWQELLQFLFNVNFAINFFLYTGFGKTIFHRELIKLLRKQRQRLGDIFGFAVPLYRLTQRSQRSTRTLVNLSEHGGETGRNQLRE